MSWFDIVKRLRSNQNKDNKDTDTEKIAPLVAAAGAAAAGAANLLSGKKKKKE
jgi:hypothetical protein